MCEVNGFMDSTQIAHCQFWVKQIYIGLMKRTRVVQNCGESGDLQLAEDDEDARSSDNEQ